MQYYSEYFKLAAVAKIATPGGRSATSLSEKLGVSEPSLTRWLRERATVKVNGEAMKQRRPEDWTAEEKVAAVLDDSTRWWPPSSAPYSYRRTLRKRIGSGGRRQIRCGGSLPSSGN
jgi:hypothetical protein